jgi:hypothetical protein
MGLVHFLPNLRNSLLVAFKLCRLFLQGLCCLIQTGGEAFRVGKESF